MTEDDQHLEQVGILVSKNSSPLVVVDKLLSHKMVHLEAHPSVEDSLAGGIVDIDCSDRTFQIKKQLKEIKKNISFKCCRVF